MNQQLHRKWDLHPGDHTNICAEFQYEYLYDNNRNTIFKGNIFIYKLLLIMKTKDLATSCSDKFIENI